MKIAKYVASEEIIIFKRDFANEDPIRRRESSFETGVFINHPAEYS